MPSSACARSPSTSTLSLHDALPILEPYVSPGARYRRYLNVAPGAPDHETNFGWVIGANLAFGPMGFHLAYDSEKFTDGTKHGVFGLRSESTRLNSSHVEISYAVFCLCTVPLDLHSFPTRRSSDLGAVRLARGPLSSLFERRAGRSGPRDQLRVGDRSQSRVRPDGVPPGVRLGEVHRRDEARSVRPQIGEHTSELQSRRDLVCRLLLVHGPPRPPLFPYTTLFRSWSRTSRPGPAIVVI